jgi:hypothetical protein
MKKNLWRLVIMTLLLIGTLPITANAASDPPNSFTGVGGEDDATVFYPTKGKVMPEEERGERRWYRIDNATGSIQPMTWGEMLAAFPEEKAGISGYPSELGSPDKVSAAVALGICIRSPRGPGIVNWKVSDPRGLGFSVKPEHSGSLVWAQPPSQAIDGIYRTSWGRCFAIKVPDHCTVDWLTSNSYSACCNAAASLVFGRVRNTNTCSGPEADWPDDPLR